MKLVSCVALSCALLAHCDGSTPGGASGGSGPRAGGPSAPAPSTTGAAPTPAPTAPVAARFAASLRVEVRASAGAEPRVATLDCGSNGASTGWIRDAEAACAALEDAVGVLQPPADDRACTMIYGGPQEARVTGTVAGRPVDRLVRRNDGCGIADWERLGFLLGAPPAEEGGHP